MVRFCNIKEGKEVEGAHKGRFTLFLTAISFYDFRYEDAYPIEYILENIKMHYEAIYIVDETNINQSMEGNTQSLVEVIKNLLKSHSVSLETSNIDVMCFYNNEHTFSYIYNINALYGLPVNDTKEVFVKYDTDTDTFVIPIDNKVIYKNKRSEIENDVPLLQG